MTLGGASFSDGFVRGKEVKGGQMAERDGEYT